VNEPSWRHDKRKTSERGYGWRWQKRRKAQLEAEPLCCMCQEEGRVTLATVADHIIPHKGDPELFHGPLQSLCASHHSGDKQRFEKTGQVRGGDAEGFPVDPNHHWNR
jgi:5-methylcytosine-specific restriction protein A